MSSSNGKKKASPKSQEEMLEMTFQYIDDEVETPDNSKSKNIVMYFKENVWIFSFVLIMIGVLIFVGKYESKPPMVCTLTGTVEEVISSNKDYAQVKLTNGQVYNYPLSLRKQVTKQAVNENDALIKPQEEICLKYTKS